MMTHDDLTDAEAIAAERRSFRELVALAVLFAALCICAAYLFGGSYPESLTACPARAVATPHQVSAPGAGALPGSPTPPRVEPGSPNECEGP
jgi:hypothetical protein